MFRTPSIMVIRTRECSEAERENLEAQLMISPPNVLDPFCTFPFARTLSYKPFFAASV